MVTRDIHHLAGAKKEAFLADFESLEPEDDHQVRKIIDFESAKSGFEKQPSKLSTGTQPNRALRENSKAERSAAVAESVITTILMLVVGLSILAAILWGL